MSMTTLISVKCDKCGTLEGCTAGIKSREVRADAKAKGWKLGKQRDLCKECADELAEAVKTLLAAG